jgi:hypothetical protein
MNSRRGAVISWWVLIGFAAVIAGWAVVLLWQGFVVGCVPLILSVAAGGNAARQLRILKRVAEKPSDD